MNSKERVLKTLNHEEPDRVPVWCGVSPEFLQKAMKEFGLSDEEAFRLRIGDDFRRVHATYVGPDDRSPTLNLPEGITYRTPFGVLRHGYGYGQPVNHPLQDATMEEVINYEWPKPEWICADEIRKDTEKWKGQYAILGGDWSPFFHDAIDLLGMEELLTGMYLNPEIVEAVMDRIVDYYFEVNKKIFQASGDMIDIYFLGNDLGAQAGPLMGGDLFEKFIARHIKRLADLAKSFGLKVMMHSCGSIAMLIDGLFAAEVDAVQALQPDAYRMEASYLKRTFGSRMTFNGCIDSHHVLIDGTPELVENTVKQILDIMKPGGGFILSPSHDYLLEETPVMNVIAMYDAAMKYGVY
ncbi:MAG: uroporphyrinogen decarboxylase family protein [Saccharofermentanales bacterium]